jgi:hypothetical protein
MLSESNVISYFEPCTLWLHGSGDILRPQSISPPTLSMWPHHWKALMSLGSELSGSWSSLGSWGGNLGKPGNLVLVRGQGNGGYLHIKKALSKFSWCKISFIWQIFGHWISLWEMGSRFHARRWMKWKFKIFFLF